MKKVAAMSQEEIQKLMAQKVGILTQKVEFVLTKIPDTML